MTLYPKHNSILSHGKRLLPLVIAILSLSACNNTNKPNDKAIITVSTLPQKYFVEQIAGDAFTINVMIPPGASPASYEPTPMQMQDLNNSSIYFYVGHLGFEKGWMNKFKQTAQNIEFASGSTGIELIEDECEGAHHHGHHHHHGVDPHIWTSPRNVKTVSQTMCDVLCKHFPEQENVFKSNLQKFIVQIEALDDSIRSTLNDTPNRSFMIFHPALAYYARDYGLTQHAIEFEGKSPSPLHLKMMIDLAKDENIGTIFIQSQFETSKAETIATEINAEVVSIDPLAENWMAEMYTLTLKMKKSLDEK